MECDKDETQCFKTRKTYKQYQLTSAKVVEPDFNPWLKFVAAHTFHYLHVLFRGCVYAGDCKTVIAENKLFDYYPYPTDEFSCCDTDFCNK